MRRLNINTNATIEKDKWYSIKQAGYLVGLKAGGIQYRISTGNIPPCCVRRMGPRRILILVSKWLELLENVI